jgi:molybdopterin/thiamine biosynthesis adenylyltransferase
MPAIAGHRRSFEMQETSQLKRDTKSVAVVGAGGNIGSHLLPHLGRMSGLGRATLIDRDLYEEKNLLSQDITPQDVGKPKAVVQARRLRRINPDVRVYTVQDSVQNVPLGQLRADVILACLDSRSARQYVNQAAWRLGVPWIDLGVQGEGLLARVNVYVPGPDAPCLECAWDERDYEALEQTYPCRGKTGEPVPTNAPSSLGALAASLQAIECQKLLTGQGERVAIGRQVLIDASYHKHYVTTFRRNPRCRFDHEVWSIEKVGCRPEELTLLQAFELGRRNGGEDGPLALRVEGKTFIRKLTCPGCGQTKSLLRLDGRLSPRERTCQCGQQMMASGFDMVERLDTGLPRQVLTRSLRSLGFRPGDVFTVGGPSGEAHCEIGG